MNGKSSQSMVSVIVVSWNARDYLRQCLTSLASEVCRYAMELIVVDNASTDGSPELVEREFPRVRLFRNASNLGFAKAANFGIRQGRGKYVCLVNSDVKVLAHCITRLVDYLEKHPDVGLAGPTMLAADGKIGRSCRGFPTVWNMFCHAAGLDLLLPGVRSVSGYTLRYWAHDTTRPVDILGGWFWILRREALAEVGLLDENFFFYAEDMDWCKRFHARGWGVVFVAEASAIHYGGASSQSAPVRYFIQKQRADRQYLRKHHCWLAQGLFYCICLLHQVTRLLGHGLLLLLTPKNAQRSCKVQRSWHSLRWLLGWPAVGTDRARP